MPLQDHAAAGGGGGRFVARIGKPREARAVKVDSERGKVGNQRIDTQVKL